MYVTNSFIRLMNRNSFSQFFRQHLVCTKHYHLTKNCFIVVVISLNNCASHDNVPALKSSIFWDIVEHDTSILWVGG